MVRYHSIDAIFMAKNTTSGSCTRHADTRCHYIREYVEEGFIKSMIVKTESKKGDSLAKHVNKEAYGKHASKFLGRAKDELIE
jgi:hypothetical protein